MQVSLSTSSHRGRTFCPKFSVQHDRATTGLFLEPHAQPGVTGSPTGANEEQKINRLLKSGVAVAALMAFGSIADAQEQQQPPVQTMPSQGGGASQAAPDTGGGVTNQMPEAQPGQAKQGQAQGEDQGGQAQQGQKKAGQKSSDSMQKKQTGQTEGGTDKKKAQESSGATGATDKASKISIPKESGRRSPSRSRHTRSSIPTSTSMFRSVWRSQGPSCSIRCRSTSSKSFRPSATTNISCWRVARS